MFVSELFILQLLITLSPLSAAVCLAVCVDLMRMAHTLQKETVSLNDFR